MTLTSVPSFVQFILVEVLKNAMKATIHAAAVQPIQLSLQSRPGPVPRVRVAVRDYGGGMPQEMLVRFPHALCGACLAKSIKNKDLPCTSAPCMAVTAAGNGHELGASLQAPGRALGPPG